MVDYSTNHQFTENDIRYTSLIQEIKWCLLQFA